jgi:hypothetical protein
MKFRGSTIASDWVFGKGKQNYLTEDNAILKNAETKLKQFYSECFFAPLDGVPWFNLLGQREQTPILVALRSQILNSYGVTAIRELIVTLTPDRDLQIDYRVDTIYTTNVSGGISL